MIPLKQYMKVNWQEEKWITDLNMASLAHHNCQTWQKCAHHNCQTGNRTLNFRAHFHVCNYRAPTQSSEHNFILANVEHQRKLQNMTYKTAQILPKTGNLTQQSGSSRQAMGKLVKISSAPFCLWPMVHNTWKQTDLQHTSKVTQLQRNIFWINN